MVKLKLKMIRRFALALGAVLFLSVPAFSQGTDFLVETTFDTHFTTRRFSTMAPFTLAGTPVISAYEDNSTTQITAGITLTVDFDTVTGLNHVRVVATGANGYEAGKSYSLIITTGTVDSVSVVGEVIGSFTLERSALADNAITAAKVAADTVGSSEIATDAIGAPELAASAIGSSEAPNLDAAITTRASQTSVDTIDDFVDTEIADIQARLPAALVGGRIDSNLGAISTDATAADNLEAEFDGTGYLGDYIRINTAQAGTATSITLDASASATDDLYNGMAVSIVSGTGAGQTRVITNYAGSTKVSTTFPVWQTIPASGSGFAVRTSSHSVLAAFMDQASVAMPIVLATDGSNGFLGANAEYISGDSGAAANLEAEYDGAGYKSYLRRGTAQAGGASSITLDSGASTSDDFYNNQIIAIYVGPGVGQARIVSDYAGSTRVATVDSAWVTQPTSSSIFELFPFSSVPGASAPTAAQNADAVWDELVADHVGAGSTGERLERLDIIASGGTGALTNARAGLLDNLDAAVTTRLAPTVAGRTLDVAATGEAGLDLDNTAGGLAKGTEVTGFNDLSAAQVNTEADTALTDYDGPTSAELVSEVDAVQADVAGVSTTIGVAGIGLTAIPSSDVVKNAALANFVFLMVDATDHVTPETGLTVTGQLSCDAGAFAGVTGTIAEIGSGFYQFDAAAGDTNCNLVTWKFSAAGADTYSVQFRTRQ